MEQAVGSKLRGFPYTHISCWTVNQKSHQQRIILFQNTLSGTQTLKLCRHGEAGIFSHVSTIKGRQRVERP